MSVFYDVVVEISVVAAGAKFDDWVVGLKGLNDDIGILVTAVGAADDLGEELESAFFGGEIWEGKAGVGLDDAKGGEPRKVEAFGDHLSADNDVEVAVFDFVVGEVESFLSFSVGIEAGDFGVPEEFCEFNFEELGAEAFV